MKRKPLIIIAAVVGALTLIIVLLPFVVEVNHFRPMITSQMQQALGRQVHIGDLRLSIVAGGGNAEEISLREDTRVVPAPILTGKSVGVGVCILPLRFFRSRA